jgi:hypothetical protein
MGDRVPVGVKDQQTPLFHIVTQDVPAMGERT